MTDREFAAEVVYGEHNRLQPALRANSHWEMRRETWDYLFGLLGGVEAAPSELLGRPVSVRSNVAGVFLRA